jgi:hypothetical protein
MWVFGKDNPADALRAFAPYTLGGYVPMITCPTLVLDGENDPGNASLLYEDLGCQKAYHLFPAAEGGSEHCHEGLMSRLHQVVFDWLDTVLHDKCHGPNVRELTTARPPSTSGSFL